MRISAAILLALTVSFTSACDKEDQLLEPKGPNPALLTCAVERVGDTPTAVRLDPECIRTILLEGNLPILFAANRLQKAKESLNTARARLLPSIDLGILASSFVNPTFTLASVQVLLPFLLPSRWFDVSRADALHDAEKVGFLLTELNEYASLMGMYATVQSDTKIGALLRADLTATEELYDLTKSNFAFGRATLSELKLAEGRMADAHVRLDRLEELLSQEHAALRYALLIDPTVRLVVEPWSAPASELEPLAVTEAVDRSMKLAPEAEQLRALLRAAEAERWSKIFSFIGGASASASAAAGQNVSIAFDTLRGNGSFQIGFDYFPMIRMAERNGDEIKIRQLELKSEITRLLDSNLSRLRNIFDRRAQAEIAANAYQEVVTIERERFVMGLSPNSVKLVEAQIRLRQASTEVHRGDQDLSILRVSLHRLLRTDGFSAIKGCVDGADRSSEDTPCTEEGVLKRLGIKRG